MKADDIKSFVRSKYGEIVSHDDSDAGGCCGSSSACCGNDYTVFSESYGDQPGYNPEADFGLGCGLPVDYAGIRPGDHVLDLGCGAGNDCFVARGLVGESGRVTGIDFTEEMVGRATTNLKKLGYNNIEFIVGDIEQMPLEDGSFDVLISNCVINLVPDKVRAFSEMKRVLRPGGHFSVSDIVVVGEMTPELRADAEMYAGCVSGAVSLGDYINIIDNCGFVEVTIQKKRKLDLPVEIGAKHLSGESETNYASEETGIYSITITAKKPE